MKSKRIYKHWQKTKEKKDILEGFKEGSSVPYLGKNYTLTVHSSEEKKTRLLFDEDSLHCILQSNPKWKPQEELVSKAMKARYKDEATRIITAHTIEIASIYKLNVNSITIKSYKWKYGQCRARDVFFDYRIIQFPLEILKHIIIHELAHIPHKNHWPNFRWFVEEMDPNMKKHKKRIKDHWILLE